MTTNYRASSTVSITLASLPSSSSLTVGRCSAVYNNATNKDDGVKPFLKVRSGSTAPTAGGSIELWAFEPRADGIWPEIFTTAYAGSDGAFTVTSRDILFAGAKLIGSVTNDATTGRDYTITGRELAQAFGFVPDLVAFFVVQSTGQNLDATAGNHALTIKAGSFS